MSSGNAEKSRGRDRKEGGKVSARARSRGKSAIEKYLPHFLRILGGFFKEMPLDLFSNGQKTVTDAPHNCAQTIHIIPADPNFEKKRSSSALFAREINLVTQPSFDCEQGINSQVQTACSNADAIFPLLGIVSCRNERFSLSRKTHVPLWNAPRISHVRLP